jgi:DNA-binding winged helix-turn-helix (wHTH) protein/predicted ATPase
MSHTRPGDLPAVRIDADNEWAWCGEQRLALPPRAFAVLRYLVEHPQRLITKDDLLTTLWRDTVVSDAALASCVRDLRKMLGDSSGSPRYIETVHRRGFRFIGPVAGQTIAPSSAGPTAARPGAQMEGRPTSGSLPTAPALVGREAEFARLHERLARALAGQRQLVFVTGEPGIGKTAFVEAFLAQIGDGDALRIGRGQCVEQYGTGEAYLPVLEALGRLGREAGGEQLVHILRQQAPTWLAQLPGLLTDLDLEAVRRRAQGATRDRMLRELVEALDALTLDAPLVLLLEDLHWSDSATIDLLAMLARRREASRLLVLGTYRPADVAGTAHPLRRAKQELQLHGYCDEVPLEFLSVAAVSQYLAWRFPGHRLPSGLARVLHRNTDGNPLFLVNTIEYLMARGQLVEIDGQWALSGPLEAVALGTPRTLWQMVEKQVDRLSADKQAMLAVAGVAGVEFSAAVAIAGGIDLHDGEERCAALARSGQFLRATGVTEWPDGTVAGRYAFIHELYQQVLYARISIGERASLHLRTGESLERGYGQRAGEIAGELAMHFEHGRDFERAVRYRRQAGENALRQHAYREAADHATRALELLRAFPDSPERMQRELTLQVMLGSALTMTQGYAAPDVARTYARVRELCEQAEDGVQLCPVLLGLGRFHNIRGEVQIARDVGTRLLTVAEATHDGAMRLAAHNALGIMAFYAGQFDAALVHLGRGMQLYDPQQHSPDRSPAFRVGQDPGVSCQVYAAWTLQLLGYPARAAAGMRDALALARSLDHPFSMAYACHFAAGFHQCRSERDAVQELEDQAFAYSTEHGFRLFPMMGAIHRGWVLSRQGRGKEGLTLVREGLAASRAIGMELRRPAFLALLAEVCKEIERPNEGLAAVAEALAAGEQTGQHYWDAELHRWKGMLTLEAETGSGRGAGKRRGHDDRSDVDDLESAASGALVERDAESCFLRAIEIARRQGAKSLELRAALSLSRLWAKRGKARDGHALLSDVFHWFTEGFDTADLNEAKVLLEDLQRRAAGGSTRADPGNTRRTGHGVA